MIKMNEKEEKEIERNSGYELPIGPIHPALKEPVSFTFQIEGERIIDAKPNIGFAHRGIEKLYESKNWFQALQLSPKTCGICPVTHQTSMVRVAEGVFEKEPTERSKYIRTILQEISRIQSHLLWLGVLGHEIGYETLFMYTWRDRERFLDLVEEITGKRVAFGNNTIGGVRRDISNKDKEKIMKALDYLRDRIQKYTEIAKNEKTLIERARGVGILDKATALKLGTVGPTTRASGVKKDVRHEEDFDMYGPSPYHIVTSEKGDAFAKTIVRVKEMAVSANIVEWCLENMPEGDINLGLNKLTKPLGGNVAVSRSEAPRGELFYYARSDEDGGIGRIKVRTPTLANILSILDMVKGGFVADIPVVVASIDPCIGCMDRVLLIDETNNEKKVMKHDELVHYAEEWFKEHEEVTKNRVRR